MPRTDSRRRPRRRLGLKRKPDFLRKEPKDYSPKVFTFCRGKRNFGVNSIGEIDGNGEHMSVCSSVDLGALNEKLGRKHTQADVDKEFDDRYRENLTAFEYGVVKGIGVLQELNNAFARVWGGAIDNKVIFNMSIEFRLFDDDVEGWKAIRKWIRQHGGIENEMDHCTHLDKSKPAGAKRWVYGKDHGRWKTQIDVIWDVTHMTRAEVEALMKKLRASCSTLWERYGVGVI